MATACISRKSAGFELEGKRWWRGSTRPNASSDGGAIVLKAPPPLSRRAWQQRGVRACLDRVRAGIPSATNVLGCP